jgi:hypothetical protein
MEAVSSPEISVNFYQAKRRSLVFIVTAVRTSNPIIVRYGKMKALVV